MIFQEKLNALMRLGMVNVCSGILPLYMVNEFPKSGGTWLSQLLAEALGVPFPRNQFPSFRSSVIHGHYLHKGGMRRPVVLWRDGRDVVVSQYYHCLFPNDRSNHALVERVRHDLIFTDYEDIKSNLPAFIDYSFHRMPYPRFNWSEFVRAWHGRDGVVYVRYEDLHRDTSSELSRIMMELTGKQIAIAVADEIAAKYSFANQAGRQSDNHKKSFLRKGVVGDWRNHFTATTCEIYHSVAGPELILLGYEPDDAWLYSM